LACNQPTNEPRQFVVYAALCPAWQLIWVVVLMFIILVLMHCLFVVIDMFPVRASRLSLRY